MMVYPETSVSRLETPEEFSQRLRQEGSALPLYRLKSDPGSMGAFKSSYRFNPGKWVGIGENGRPYTDSRFLRRETIAEILSQNRQGEFKSLEKIIKGLLRGTMQNEALMHQNRPQALTIMERMIALFYLKSISLAAKIDAREARQNGTEQRPSSSGSRGDSSRSCRNAHSRR